MNWTTPSCPGHNIKTQKLQMGNWGRKMDPPWNTESWQYRFHKLKESILNLAIVWKWSSVSASQILISEQKTLSLPVSLSHAWYNTQLSSTLVCKDTIQYFNIETRIERIIVSPNPKRVPSTVHQYSEPAEVSYAEQPTGIHKSRSISPPKNCEWDPSPSLVLVQSNGLRTKLNQVRKNQTSIQVQLMIWETSN